MMLSVSDSGTGMSPEVLSRVFEPFFTTKGPEKGTGLGLSMVYGFVKQSNGHVKIYSEVSQGTTIRLYLPAADARELETGTGGEHAHMETGNETILVVEDKPEVRQIAVMHLNALGYKVLEAESAAVALEILRGSQTIDLLFSDIVMPGGSGTELADEATSLRPGLKVLFTSGFTSAAAKNRQASAGGMRILSKPYRKQELALTVKDVLQRTR